MKKEDVLSFIVKFGDFSAMRFENYSNSMNEIKEYLNITESKAIQWDDPQTQADLELAAAVRLAFEKGNRIGEGPYYDFVSLSENSIDLIEWYREQKRGAE